MAKSATIITILFAALVLFAALEAPTMVEGRSCDRESGTWSSEHCWNNNACNNQCVRVEGAQRGACNYRVPGGKCVCYFPWPC